MSADEELAVNRKTCLYHDKPKQYFEQDRNDIVTLVPSPAGRVLEVGCAEGGTLRILKQEKGATEIHGIDIAANAQGLDSFYRMDIECEALPFNNNSFDTVICADIFEHLVDPWSAMQHIVALLRPNGIMVTSFPNIRHFHILSSIILHGDFKYSDTGILDRSHLRFFCLNNMIRMMTSAGLTIASVHHSVKGRRALLNYIVGGWLMPFMVFQYRVVAHKRETV